MAEAGNEQITNDPGDDTARTVIGAAVEPATAWPGHHGPPTGDVRGALERVVAA